MRSGDFFHLMTCCGRKKRFLSDSNQKLNYNEPSIHRFARMHHTCVKMHAWAHKLIKLINVCAIAFISALGRYFQGEISKCIALSLWQVYNWTGAIPQSAFVIGSASMEAFKTVFITSQITQHVCWWPVSYSVFWLWNHYTCKYCWILSLHIYMYLFLVGFPINNLTSWLTFTQRDYVLMQWHSRRLSKFFIL